MDTRPIFLRVCFTREGEYEADHMWCDSFAEALKQIMFYQAEETIHVLEIEYTDEAKLQALKEQIAADIAAGRE